MMRLWFGILLASILALPASERASAQGMGPGMERPGMGMGKGEGMARHRHFMMNGIPAAYLNLENPLSATPHVIARGRELYDENCALCHGPGGRGDGEAAKDLDPKPGDLILMNRMPMATDGYFFWAISDGGEAIGTDMPVFKDVLSAEERWTIITALRAGLPPAQP